MLHKFYSLVSSRSYKWPQVRKEHLKKQPHCQACGSNKNPVVHHIEPFHTNPDKELDPNNLITLCKKHCHYTIGHLMDYRSWNPNVIEDAKVYLDKVQNRPYKIIMMDYNEKNYLHIITCFFKFISNCWNNRS